MATVPLALTWTPITVPVNALDINQLGIVLCKQISGKIDSSGQTTLYTGTVNPATDVGLFFNTTANLLMVWDGSVGKYVPMTGNKVGDTKDSFVQADDVNSGWIVCDGRAISAIPGISTSQRASLQALFGTTLPVINAIRQLTGLPANGTIAGISVPTTAPAEGAFAGISISGTYASSEVSEIRDDSELLRNSTEVTADALRQLRDKTESIRDALAGVSSALGSLVTKVFCGYP